MATTPRIGILIQARTRSSRLPGKIYSGLPGARDQALLEHIYRRLEKVPGCVATLVLAPENDQRLLKWCKERQLKTLSGPEDDVRERYRRAARQLKLDLVVRATADNPCVDHNIAYDTILEMIRRNVDLLSFSNLPLGVAVEVFKTRALCQDVGTSHEPEQEHVSLHIKHNPDKFKVVRLNHPLMEYFKFTPPRLTVDTPEDLQVVRNVFDELGPSFSTADVLRLYQLKAEIFAANKHIEQRIVLPAAP